MLTSWIFVLALLFVGNVAARRSRLLLALNFPGSLVGGVLGGVLMFVLQSGFSARVEVPADRGISSWWSSTCAMAWR